MSMGDHLGFDLDEETIDILDAILVNIATDDELKEEFKKLKFIQSLKDRYDHSPGPFRQVLEKVSRVEQERYHLMIDMRRLVADMEHLTATVREATGRSEELLGKNSITSISTRQQYFCFNLKDK